METVGLGRWRRLWAGRDEHVDTFKLMTRQRHRLAAVMVQHFFAVSSAWDEPELVASKKRRRDEWLAALRTAVAAG